MGRNGKYRWEGNQLVKVDNSKGGQTGPANGHGSDTFTCVVDSVTSCSRGAAPTIYVDSRLWQSIVALCASTDTEWLAYLIGEKDAEGDYEVKRLSFPPQSAGGAHVRNHTNPDFRVEEGTIGAIHSHVRMQAFFSQTDVNHANWPVEIVVNARGEYETSVRVTLPCGESMRRKSSIALLTGGILQGMEEKLKEALAKGKEQEEAARAASSTSPRYAWPPNGGEGFDGHASEYGFLGRGAYDAANQDDRPGLVLGKFLNCPICGKPATKCPHSGQEMEKYIETGAKPATTPEDAARQLFGGKYLWCPVPGCGKYACGPGACKHNLAEMDASAKSQEAARQVAP